jgi:hypothetical protein
MVQQQRYSQRILAMILLCLLTTNVQTSAIRLKKLITDFTNFLQKKKIVKFETLSLMLIVLTPYAIAKQLSRKEAHEYIANGLSWKDLLKINEIGTKEYWKRAAHLLIGTFEKVSKDKYKKKLENGDILVKDQTKYIPPTGVFCTIHDLVTAPLKDLNEMMKNSQTFYGYAIAIAILLTSQDDASNEA